MKNNKGVTLVSLVIIIIVMLILITVAVYSGGNSLKSSKRLAFISELEIIQAKVNTIYEKRDLNSEDREYYNNIGKDLSLIDENKLNLVLGETPKDGFRYFVEEDLKKIDIENIKQEVIINFDTRKVISLTGLEIDKKIYYKLEDIPNYNGYNIEYVNKNNKEPSFDVDITKLDNSWIYTIKDIVYNNNVNDGRISYKLHSDTNWILVDEFSFEVINAGLYDIKLTDKAGNSKTIQKFSYVTDELLAHYDAKNNTGIGYNQTATTWKDLSGNKRDAILNNFTYSQTSGWRNNNLILDGINSNVNIPVSINASSSMTLEIVYNDYDHSKSLVIDSDVGWKAFSFHTYYSKDVNNNNVYDGSIYIGGNYEIGKDKDRFSPSEIAFKTRLNKIDKITYTYNGNTRNAELYVNGNMLANKTYTANPEAIQNFTIGVNQNKAYYNIKIYGKALSKQEVKANYEIDKYRFEIE